jgi:hypothetical protein
MSANPERPKNGDGATSPRSGVAMSAADRRGGGAPSPSVTAAPWRQAALITLGAAAIYVGMRALPTGVNLHAGDFRVAGVGALELCDPANPQFVPVVTARSPVTMTVAPAPGGGGRFLLRLATSTDKPVGPAELLEVHTRKLHLLIVDPTLADYQHVHPEPTANVGEWGFAFAPRLGGTYRVFADFTPVVTGRSLYASADLAVDETRVERDVPARSVGAEANVAPIVGPESAPSPSRSTQLGADHATHLSGVSAANAGLAWPAETWRAERDGLVFQLVPSARPVRAGQAADFAFTIARSDGGPAALELVMGALAHLVAFDSERGGFAHLHPYSQDAAQSPALGAVGDRATPGVSAHGLTPGTAGAPLAFRLTIPSAGRYVIWAQVKIGGREVFAPFWFEVAP